MLFCCNMEKNVIRYKCYRLFLGLQFRIVGWEWELFLHRLSKLEILIIKPEFVNNNIV